MMSRVVALGAIVFGLTVEAIPQVAPPVGTVAGRSSLAIQGTPFAALDVERAAFAARGSLTGARLRVLEAGRNRRALAGAPATRLDLGVGTPVDFGGSPDFAIYQPIDIFGKSRAAARQGEAALALALASYRQAALDVQQEALVAYANLGAAQRLLDLARTQRDLAEAVRLATARRVAARDLPELQSARAELEVARADGLVADRAAAVESARLRLAAALGKDDLAIGTAEPLPAPDTTPPNLAETRPELLTLRSEQAAAEAEAGATRLDLYPNLEIQAGRTPFLNHPEYGIRLQLSTLLFDGGVTKNRVRAANARRDAAKASYDDRLRAAEKDVAASRVEFAAAERSESNYAALVVGARTLLDRTQRGFELGANTLVDVLDARRALSDSEELRINAILRRDLAAEVLLRAQGRFLEEPK